MSAARCNFMYARTCTDSHATLKHERKLSRFFFFPFLTFSHDSCVRLKMTRCHRFLIWIDTYTQKRSERDTQVLCKWLTVAVPRGCPKQRQNKRMAHTCCRRLGLFGQNGLSAEDKIYRNRLHVFSLAWKLFFFGGNLYYMKGVWQNYCLS